MIIFLLSLALLKVPDWSSFVLWISAFLTVWCDRINRVVFWFFFTFSTETAVAQLNCACLIFIACLYPSFYTSFMLRTWLQVCLLLGRGHWKGLQCASQTKPKRKMPERAEKIIWGGWKEVVDGLRNRRSTGAAIKFLRSEDLSLSNLVKPEGAVRCCANGF